MSHELRTPLNAIIGYSELLHEAAASCGQTEGQEDLMKIRAAGRHLLSLVNDLLDISKIEAGKIELDIETFHLADVLASSVNTIRPLAEKNRNQLHIVAHPSVTMRSDRTKVCQVLINILSNACKFTIDGHVSLTSHSRDPIRGISRKLRSRTAALAWICS